MKKFLIFALTILPILAVASDDSGRVKDYDIIWRTINFAVFFGILFYLIKGPIKTAYNNRIKSISGRLEAIQNKLLESKNQKEQIKKELETAKVQCAELIETAKKEAVFAAQKVKNSTELEIKQMQKSLQDQKEFERRKATKAVVNEVLEEIFDKNSINLSQDELINILQKKAV